jgi:hypothetical protein
MQYQFSPLNSQPDTGHESLSYPVVESQRVAEAPPKTDFVHTKIEGIL